ncbi:RibD family protein [Streptomyces sp. NPDC051567]|uniref:RibD family protein n=1 Tax=Streptomyces sp. NPDC051567 TaxID=3365660 RepID=UPI0037A7292A
MSSRPVSGRAVSGRAVGAAEVLARPVRTAPRAGAARPAGARARAGRGRPYVLLSAAMSVDGRLDDAGPERLLLSSPEDFDRVDAVRASCDALLVGAGTLRKDDPRLLVGDLRRRAARVSHGRPADPLKVTVTASPWLDPELRFWHCGGEKVVFTVDAGVEPLRETLGALAEVVGVGPELDWARVLDALGRRGVGRLMVEGGSSVHTQLLALDLADELQVAVAPLLVGQAGAPRLVGTGAFPGGPGARMRLLGARVAGDAVVLRYAPKERVG